MSNARTTPDEIKGIFLDRFNFPKRYYIHDKKKRELEMIEELVKENGRAYIAVNAANLILSKKAQEMGLNIENIINEDKNKNSVQSKSSSNTSTTPT